MVANLFFATMFLKETLRCARQLSECLFAMQRMAPRQRNAAPLRLADLLGRILPLPLAPCLAPLIAAHSLAHQLGLLSTPLAPIAARI